jgi:hypothetical protein
MKFCICSSSLQGGEIRSCHTSWQSPRKIFFSISIFTFSLTERASRLLLGLVLSASLLLCFGAIITVNMGFLNKNNAITWQLIRTARTLAAEWWQVCGKAWVRGQREMSQVLGAFGLLDFTMLGPVLAWCAFWNLWTVLLTLQFWGEGGAGGAVNRGYGGPPVHGIPWPAMWLIAYQVCSMKLL